MGEVQLQLQEESKGPLGSPDYTSAASQSPILPSKSNRWHWWLKVALCTFSVLVGQTGATLLWRFYYNQGGNSMWMGALVSTAGFPIFLPVLLFSFPLSTNPILRPNITGKISLIYIAIGLMTAGDNLMYSYGLLYLPVSTFSLVCATQLAFNAVFSYFLNSQKLTPLIFNSVILLTFSSALLGVSSGSDGSSTVSKEKYPLGFILTLAASATFSLILSLSQLTFHKVLKRDTFSVVLEMIICTGFVATVTCVVGLFASGEGRGLKGEMEGFAKGKVCYVMILVSTTICWMVSAIGTVGLTFVVSSLFSNVIGTFALPVVPIFAVIFFHDSMNGVKVVAMLIAIWGFLSYIYQNYLDDSKAKAPRRNTEVCGNHQGIHNEEECV